MQLGLAQATQVRGWLAGSRQIAAQLAAAMFGFLMSGASILSVCAPFGVAWAGAAPPELALSAAVGSVLGYAVLLRGQQVLRYLAAAVLLMGLRWAFCFVAPARMQRLSPLLAGLSLGVTGAAVALSEGTAAAWALTGCEAAIAVTAGLLFSRARAAVTEKSPFAGTAGVCCGITLAVLYMGLCGLSVGGVSPARIGALWLILCCASAGGAGAGTLCGVSAGLAAALTGQPELLGAYAAGGLAAGVFAPVGRLAGAAVMALALAIGLLAGGGAITAAAIAEYALSAALLMLTPLWLLRRLGFRPVPDAAQGEMLCRAVDARLCRARDALAGIADVTQQVAKRLEGLRGDPLETHLTRATDAVCRGCGQSPRCWQTAYSVTDDAVRHFFAAARARCGEADETDFPAHFSCERLPRLMPALNEEARSYVRQQNARRQASQMRAVSADQFEGMSLLLDGISREVAALLPAPAAVSAAIEQYFERAGAQPLSVCCALDELQRISVVAVFPARKATRLDLAKVTAELSELASQELALPEQLFEGDSTRLWWSVRARFAAECGHAQRAARCARLCGDSVADFRDAAGRAVLLLSDGMGVGGSAAVDATMTTSLLSRLLRAGATFDAALRLVNAALLSGGGEERLCTVDACVLDLTTGQLDLYKAGAAPTFLIRQNRVQRIETASLPAGILGGAEARHTVLTLGDGDVVVMVSDGVTDTGTDWIPSQLQALAGQTPAVLCERLLATAVERRIGDREDDMSVLAAVVTQD